MEGRFGPWSESSPQPGTSEEPTGSSLPRDNMSYKAGGQRELVGRRLGWRRSARPQNRAKRSSQLLCKALFPCKGENKNSGPSSGHLPVKLLAAPLPFFSVWKVKSVYCLAHGPALWAVSPPSAPQMSSFTHSPASSGHVHGQRGIRLLPLSLRDWKSRRETGWEGDTEDSAFADSGIRTQGT